LQGAAVAEGNERKECEGDDLYMWSRNDMTISEVSHRFDGSEIAIIGMAGRFPGAQNLSAFWANLRNGVESVTRFSDEQLLASGVDPEAINDPRYVNARSVLADIDRFDAAFFGFSPREAESMDPQHRLLMECVWEAVERAGYDPDRFDGAISLFAGSSINSYLLNNLYANPEAMALAGDFQVSIFNNPASLATAIAYKLNLKGQCFTILTFCSTSLVATHLACQSLLNFECDMAVAGGVSIFTPQNTGYWFQEGLIVSPDGRCRPFDSRANGTVFGNGLGVVVLRRLEDALADGDTIDAVIIGSATNNDGSVKVSYTAPSVAGQAAVIVEAMANAEVDPESISYVETHGTATTLGDPIEIAALSQAFRTGTEKKNFCAIGSVKSNIGHLDVAAGAASLIKTVLALKHKEIPPSLNFQHPNPDIDFDNSPFFVNGHLSEWGANGFPRRAGVSSFGVGGTNAHVIVQEAPEVQPSAPSRPWQILMFSARTNSALDAMTANFVDHIKEQPDSNLADIAYTLKVGRKVFGHRRMAVCNDVADAAATFEANDPKRVTSVYQEHQNPPVVFMFTGQGSQYVNMGLELYNIEAEFKKHIDHCAEILKPLLGSDLRDIIYPAPDNVEESTRKLRNTIVTQPALFTIEYALAKLWLSWGIQPAALIGHSIGEYVAACLAGVFSLEDALAMVSTRGKLIQRMPAGSMLAVMLSEKEMAPLLGTELSLAAVNGPSFCVVSGPKEAVQALERLLSEKKVDCRYLHTSHAFHSQMMDPILDEFAELAGRISFKTPQFPIASTVTGKWVSPDEIMVPGYWIKNLRQTVRFNDAVSEMLKEAGRIFLEVGPGQTLSTLVKQHQHRSKDTAVLFSLRHPQEEKSDCAVILTTLGSLWLNGIEVDWQAFYSSETRRRVPLPSYPFERQRCWIDPAEPPRGFLAARVGLVNKSEESAAPSVETLSHSESVLNHSYFVPETRSDGPRTETERHLAVIWQKVLGVKDISIHDNYFELGGNSINAARLFAQIDKIFGQKIPLGTLLESPTLKDLAKVINVKDPLSSLSSLVNIQGGNSKPAFFCVQSASGHVLEYRRLAHHLGPDQPFFALQTNQINGEDLESLRVEHMATHYLEEIKTVQPEGPYFLGGYCFGGLVAFEMAQQLKSNGEQVAFVAMINSSTPRHLVNTLPHITSLHNRFYRIAERIELEFDNISTLKVKQKLSYIKDRIWRTLFLSMVRIERMIDPLVTKLKTNRDWHSFDYNLQNLIDTMDKYYMKYEPEFYEGRVTLFRVSNQPSRLVNDSYLGWRDLAGSIDVYEVPGFHKNILREPNVNGLGRKLRWCMEEARNLQNNDNRII